MSIQEVKERHSLLAYVERALGPAKQKSGHYHNFLCPFHNNTNTPAFSVFIGSDGEEHWTCNGECGKSGDIIDFVMEFDGFSTIQEAVNHLDGNFAPAPKRKWDAKPEAEVDLNPQAFEFHTHLPQAMYWFNKRGINADVAEAHWLGATMKYTTTYTCDDGKVLKFWTRGLTLPNRADGKTRAINIRRHDEFSWVRFKDTLVEAPEDMDALRRDLQKKHQTEVTDQMLFEAMFLRYKQVTGSKRNMPFNIEALLKIEHGRAVPRNLSTILISCEVKEIDILSLTSQKYRTVGVLPTWPKLPELFASVRHPFILQDNDDAGREKAERMREALKHPHAMIIPAPDGMKDGNDAVVAGVVHEWLRRYGVMPTL